MKRSASELFIVDNSDADWKVRSYLKDWCELSSAIDIATGYFEIGALLTLDEKWQAVDQIRILLGDEVSLRTKRAFAQSLQKISERLDASLENEKGQNDFLKGVPAIVEAIRTGKIACRVYRKEKFHAKAYLTHGRAAVIGSFGLVGSSNFTYPGLTDNVELNVQIRGADVGLLQEWYERHWNEAEDVSPDLLRTIERHTRDYSPFEVWVKALDELMRGHELTPDEWDREHSRLFPILAKYQQDAYKNLVQIADRFGSAFLCDGVGLGKTFVGLMLLERMVVREGKRVVLFAPKAAREDVWERAIQRHLPHLNSGFVNFVLYNHTDLQRKGRWPRDIELTLRDADVVLIDEAHHFRNPGIKGEGEKEASRYRLLQRYLQSGERPKQVFMLTATPVNNSIHDFRHMIELAGNESVFATQLGIHNLRSHFNQREKHLLGKLPDDIQLDLEFGTEIFAAEQALRTDRIFDAIVVQRSRGYVKQSQRCMFCSGSEAAQVEHFRPKSLFPLEAMKWENFLWACGICNLNKGCCFPPQTEPGEAIINPLEEDVWSFFFIDEFGNLTARWRTDLDDVDPRAAKTIEILALDRDALQESRQQRLDDLKNRVRDSLALFQHGHLAQEELHARCQEWRGQPFQPDVASYFLDGPGRGESPFSEFCIEAQC